MLGEVAEVCRLSFHSPLLFAIDMHFKPRIWLQHSPMVLQPALLQHQTALTSERVLRFEPEGRVGVPGATSYWLEARCRIPIVLPTLSA